jgi:hypothetical protein
MFVKMNGQEMNNKSRLTLESRHQLIDLNKEYVNFDITFECRAVDASKDFEIIVVNQEQLNTIDLTNLTMKMTKNGYISGNIIADEDKYQNYFLILRAPTEEPIDVDLEIKIKQIEPKNNPDAQQFPQTDQQMMMPPPLADHSPYMDDPLSHCQSSTPTNNTHIIFMVFGLLIVGGAVGYYFWKNSKKSGDGNHLAIEDDVRSVCSDMSYASKASSSDESGILDTLIKKSK